MYKKPKTTSKLPTLPHESIVSELDHKGHGRKRKPALHDMQVVLEFEKLNIKETPIHQSSSSSTPSTQSVIKEYSYSGMLKEFQSLTLDKPAEEQSSIPVSISARSNQPVRNFVSPNQSSSSNKPKLYDEEIEMAHPIEEYSF